MLLKFSLFYKKLCGSLSTSHIFFNFLFLLATASVLLNQIDMHGSCQISQGKIGGGVVHFNLSHRMGT